MAHDFQHFIEAQEGVFEAAMQELRAGQKRTHWMWFVFPQLLGLGHSETSRRFGIDGLEEARRYLQHPVLGPRLEQAAQAAMQSNTPLARLFGTVDAQKFISSMTLFSRASAREDSIFAQILERLQTRDARTERMLEG
ncbi:DUF1810 domain-containing protein [Comamonas endophytica]|uniref:DUF1810 domain-containing protein n=1 Tax=Comamonas endophytica TaxID=2949090 RepID=A0ABY6GFC3_9BURK|nr:MULTISPECIES: DUF1810 domain-containing protein [unclassified Acidovorax]MCD2514355.1 DUF1810 domain-containing protein [Acidovorax sp. D4N7]UYG53601.1 DUF1810 domain-containing protein [Acidovorax sp. 5MLIR]UYG53646.1 DUF1810 domain-containing protein [Acidovorax sp. 5MLIR]